MVTHSFDSQLLSTYCIRCVRPCAVLQPPQYRGSLASLPDMPGKRLPPMTQGRALQISSYVLLPRQKKSQVTKKDSKSLRDQGLLYFWISQELHVPANTSFSRTWRRVHLLSPCQTLESPQELISLYTRWFKTQ